MTSLPKAVFLMGPTASGKTACAIHLLKRKWPLELISVDSAQVFQGMDIGTAKLSPEVLAQVPHHLIDIISPEARYSAAQFRLDALRLMADITARGKIPLLVGGTLLYFSVLEKGLHELPPADPLLRAQLMKEAIEKGWPFMHTQLARLDPKTADRLSPHDSQRIGRALEICLLADRPLSTILKESVDPLPYHVVKIALLPSDRTTLYERINQRFSKMLDQGLVEEVEDLRSRHCLSADDPSMRCVGYRQVWNYLEGLIDRKTLIIEGCTATRQMAKRQLTWLRKMEPLIKLDYLDNHLFQRVMDQVSPLLEVQAQ